MINNRRGPSCRHTFDVGKVLSKKVEKISPFYSHPGDEIREKSFVLPSFFFVLIEKKSCLQEIVFPVNESRFDINWVHLKFSMQQQQLFCAFKGDQVYARRYLIECKKKSLKKQD